MRGRGLKYFGLLVLIPGVFLLIAWIGYRITPESAPVARGAKSAVFGGCIECHGDPDNRGPDESAMECTDVNQTTWHPDYNVACIDVLAFFESVRVLRTFDTRVKDNKQNLLIAGEQLARRYHCFNCHGQLGQGGLKNSRSFKGYVPGYFGRDFKILTQNGDKQSVRRWIMYGIDPTILENPVTGRIAEYFFEGQAIHMPGFKSLKPEDIETLVDYVIALNKYGPMTASQVRRYAEDSVSISTSKKDIGYESD